MSCYLIWRISQHTDGMIPCHRTGGRCSAGRNQSYSTSSHAGEGQRYNLIFMFSSFIWDPFIPRFNKQMSLQYLRDPWEDIFDSYHNCSSTKAQTMIFHRCPMIKNDQDKNNDDNIQGTVADQHRSFVRLIQAKTVLTGLKTHQRHIDMRQVIGR